MHVGVENKESYLMTITLFNKCLFACTPEGLRNDVVGLKVCLL